VTRTRTAGVSLLGSPLRAKLRNSAVLKDQDGACEKDDGDYSGNSARLAFL
jgi:hypothetical protein